MFNPLSLCVIGAILVIFGLWLHATIYWELRNAPAFKKKLEELEIKEKNKEGSSFGNKVNLKIPRIGKKIAKLSIVGGFIIIAIGCIAR